MQTLLSLELRRAATATLLGSALVTSPTAAQSPFSAFAEGSARELEFICAGCVNPSRSAWRGSQGGAGSTSALVENDNAGRFAARARATLASTPNTLPELGALARADVHVEPDPLFPKVFFHSASAVAQAFQPFRYLGNTPSSYTIDYLIEGLIDGGPDDEQLNTNTISGGITVYQGLFDPIGEAANTVLVQLQGSRRGTGGIVPVSISGSVVFPVAPYDTFTPFFFLAAGASSMLDGSPGAASAFNSMTARFSAGDTSLLELVTVSPVSEAPPAALLAAGLAALAALSRRRRDA